MRWWNTRARTRRTSAAAIYGRATDTSKARSAHRTSASRRMATAWTRGACWRPGSSTKRAAEPSQTDINLAEYPDWLYLIVSLDGEPTVRGWWIRDGKVAEEELELVES